MSHRILQQLGVTPQNAERADTLLHNLTKLPPKVSANVVPHTYASKAWATEQADLLHLPDDDGYKYLLVVVDIATRKCDAEPLKTRDSKTVKKGLIKIFKRKIIHQPSRLEVDDGSEFKGDFAQYFSKLLEIQVKEPGRHRQQSVVESKNHIIGDVLNKRMLAEEINNHEESKSWVDIVPQVVRLINKEYAHPAVVIHGDREEKTDKTNKHLLTIGTECRYLLDNPIRYTDGQRMHGTFRAGDIRWSKEHYPITRFYLRPDEPPLYELGDDGRVAYSREQLQVVPRNEIRPLPGGQHKFIIDHLIKRFKQRGKIYFDVKWDDGSITQEPRTELMKDVPHLVRAFETEEH